MENSKKMNLEILETATNKVTVGFKCKPEVKLGLAHEAQTLGMTLSEYVESLVLNRSAFARSLSTREQVNELEKRLAFYESGKLADALEKHKGKTHPLKNGREIRVESIQDVFTILLDPLKF